MKGNLFWLLVLWNTITPIYYKRRVIRDKDNWAAFYLLVVHCFVCLGVCVLYIQTAEYMSVFESSRDREQRGCIQEETEVGQDADRGDILCQLFLKRLAPPRLLPEPSRANMKQRKDRCSCYLYYSSPLFQTQLSPTDDEDAWLTN